MLCQVFWFFFSFFEVNWKLERSPRHTAHQWKSTAERSHDPIAEVVIYWHFSSKPVEEKAPLPPWPEVWSPEPGIQRQLCAWYSPWCKSPECKSWRQHYWWQKSKQAHMGLWFHNSHKEPNFYVGFAPEQESGWWPVLCWPPSWNQTLQDEVKD